MALVIHLLYGLGIVLLVAAMLLDLLSLYLWLARNIRGHGASGVPAVSWIIYFLLVKLRPILQTVQHRSIHPPPDWRALLALTLFHALCQYVIPIGHAGWIKRKRRV